MSERASERAIMRACVRACVRAYVSDECKKLQYITLLFNCYISW